MHAVSPNATHHGGVLEYDTHNLFGHQILNATYNALLSVFPRKRPFIIGRSTFAGSGKWAGHWGGDNASLWAYRPGACAAWTPRDPAIGRVAFLTNRGEPAEAILGRDGLWRCPAMPVLDRVLNALYAPDRSVRPEDYGREEIRRVADWFRKYRPDGPI